jgi:RimJ/RimL family protein N-acetyltransferase
MNIRLIEIGVDGLPAEVVSLTDVAHSVCEACAAMYRKSGFLRPWIAYLALRDGQVVGSCAFKSPPLQNRVEIAYFTLPDYEGQGIATQMAQRLVSIVEEADDKIDVLAQTLPHENASTSILRKLNFVRIGTAQDEEIGEAWEWKMSR